MSCPVCKEEAKLFKQVALIIENNLCILKTEKAACKPCLSDELLKRYKNRRVVKS